MVMTIRNNFFWVSLAAKALFSCLIEVLSYPKPRTRSR